MNINDLESKITNIQISLDDELQRVKFSNTDIVVIDEFGYRWKITSIEYPPQSEVIIRVISIEGGEKI